MTIAVDLGRKATKQTNKKTKVKFINCTFSHGLVHLISFSDTYDGLAVAGGMGEGHIPCSAIEEMIRVVKSGMLLK